MAQNKANYKWYVKSYTVRVLSTDENGNSSDLSHLEYLLYYGSKESEKIDELITMGQIGFGAMMFHPVPEVAADMKLQAPERWYIQVYNYQLEVSQVYKLFQKDIWDKIPPNIQHLIIALDFHDNELILVHFRGYTRSISIYYLPKYNRDVAFYKAKLKKLEKYMNSVDVSVPVPLPIEQE